MRLCLYSLQRHAEYAARLSTADPQCQRDGAGNCAATHQLPQQPGSICQACRVADQRRHQASCQGGAGRGGACEAARGGPCWLPARKVGVAAESACCTGRAKHAASKPAHQHRHASTACQPSSAAAQRHPATTLHCLIGSGRTLPAHPLLSIAFSPAPYPVGAGSAGGDVVGNDSSCDQRCCYQQRLQLG